MGKQTKKPELVKVSSVRIRKDVFDYIVEKVKKSDYGSVSHGIEKLSYMGMRIEKENERVVHRYNTGFNIDEPEEEEKLE